MSHQTTKADVRQVLQPLKVRDDDTTGVEEKVRHHKDALFLQHSLGRRGHRTVGGLTDDLGLV